MKTLVFAMPGNEQLASSLVGILNAELGDALIRRFPDGESYVRINSDVKNKKVIVVCTLAQPDDKFLPLYFLAKTLKEQGAGHVCLVAPYLAYMRQDKMFNSGESVTSIHFAKLLSDTVDQLITIDPHLHRRKGLSEIYNIPTIVLHANDHISNWVKNNIKLPVLIGPDSESEQWVSEVAAKANCPYIILQKNRKGDRDVEISIPHLEEQKNRTPVLVDDIISTAKTMIETIKHLQKLNMPAPVCIGVHGIFAGNAYAEMQQQGAAQIITCNTIIHPSNAINIADLLAKVLK